MRSTFNIIFYINRNKQKKNGLCPLYGRITVDGKQVQFSLKEEIDTSLWSVKQGRSLAKDKAGKDLNQKLEGYEQRLKYLHNKMIEDNAYVTAEGLKNALLNKNEKEATLLKYFEKHNQEYLKYIGVTRSKSTYTTYIHAYNCLRKFIDTKYNLTDISFCDLQYSFITDFEFFLQVNMGFRTSTIFHVINKLKRIIYLAISDEIIRKNPFADFRCKLGERNRKFLSKEELAHMMHTPMENPKTEFVRMLFLFSTFTGLAFVDLHDLKWDEIITDNTGQKWIQKKRQKTGTNSIIPLLDIPLKILEKYKLNRENNERVFDVPYYQLVLFYLKKIQKALGITSLSYHMSRHTYASTICLNNGVPIETLSRMLGHKDISTTQIYAKIGRQKVDRDMKTLEITLGNKYNYSNVIDQNNKKNKSYEKSTKRETIHRNRLQKLANSSVTASQRNGLDEKRRIV